MYSQVDSETLEDMETQEYFDCKNSKNDKFSELNAESDVNSMKKKYIQPCPASEKNINSENQLKIDSNNFRSTDEDVTRSDDIDKKKVVMCGKTNSFQETMEIENLIEKNPKVLNINKIKDVTVHDKIKKGNISPKKTCPTKQSNKVYFQMKNKKANEVKNIKNDSNKVDGVNKQVSSKSIVDSLTVNPKVLENPYNITSNDVQTRQILDYGFMHLKEEMKAVIQQCVEKEDRIESLEKRLKETDVNYSDMKKKCLHLEQKNEKMSKNLEEVTKKFDKSVQDLNSANAFIAEARPIKKIADNTILDLEKRLAQTLAINEKMKAKLDEINLGGKNAQISAQKRIEEMTETNKLLSRQKSELREVVIKQMKIVSNLKRQVLHLKGGMVQTFTEQEVMKVIDEFY